MNIVVCIKHVPDTAHLKFDPEKGIIQDSIEYIMNPFCEYAVETALRLKEAKEGSKVTVISLGQAQAKEALKRAIAMGADEAYLLSDPAFVDGDDWATAYTLSTAIKKLVPDTDLILLGQQALDVMTGMTGPALAEFSGLPSVTLTKNVEVKDDRTLKIHRETPQGVEVYEMTLPGVISVMKCDYEPRIPAIKGVMKANRTEIPVVDLAGLGLSDDQVGIKGSPTMIVSAKTKPKKQGGMKVDGSDPQAAVNQLIGFLREQKVL